MCSKIYQIFGIVWEYLETISKREDYQAFKENADDKIENLNLISGLVKESGEILK